MHPEPLPIPMRGGYLADVAQSETDPELAGWLFALEDKIYLVPVSQQIVNDAAITLRHPEQARELTNTTQALEQPCIATKLDVSPEAVPAPIIDQLAVLSLGHRSEGKDAPIGIVWRGSTHIMPTRYDPREGAADTTDFMREPELEITVIEDQQYVTGTDWYFPHRTGALSWYLHDFRDPSLILNRPVRNDRLTSNITNMKLAHRVPADIPEKHFLHLKGGGSSITNVTEVILPDRRMVLPCVIDLFGMAYSKRDLTQPSSLLFRSGGLFAVPIETDAATQAITVRCDLSMRSDIYRIKNLDTTPLLEENLYLSPDVSAAEESALAWAAHALYAPTQKHPVTIRQRDPSHPLRLQFRFAQEAFIERADEQKALVGVIYNVGKGRWFIPVHTQTRKTEDLFNPAMPKIFALDEICAELGRVKGKAQNWNNLRLSVGKPSENTLHTLRVALAYRYRREIAAGAYKIA